MKHQTRCLARIFFGAVAISVAASIGANAADPPSFAALSARHRQGSEADLPKMAPGFRVELYAHVPQPENLSFSADGSLYVGSNSSHIHKVGPGGHPVRQFGPAVGDPDSVLADDAGLISGHRHSVLVGGGGTISAIYQNQALAVIFNSGFADVDDMKFDRNGRLIFSDDNPQVLSSTGGPPTVLFTTPSRPGDLAINDQNQIFVVLADGTIRIYTPDGTPAGIFATGLAGLDTSIAFSDGGGFGKFLYALSGSTLLRFDKNGKSTVIGTGFGIGLATATGFVFGPDHALYVTDFPAQRILRIARGHGR